jgi:hypothetical protein
MTRGHRSRCTQNESVTVSAGNTRLQYCAAIMDALVRYLCSVTFFELSVTFNSSLMTSSVTRS